MLGFQDLFPFRSPLALCLCKFFLHRRNPSLEFSRPCLLGCQLLREHLALRARLRMSVLFPFQLSP